ncbi:MAG: Type 1 glutamine amidotransferase-like domain-containing protein [Candidatus Levybacteria bacterium]|nr:Type 1 glutamine amidotransferase-like domain-containing protein [Candidatus Levybacteria bacterium]
MKLFLTSNAYQTLDLITPLLPTYPPQMTVAFIPTAADMYDTALWMERDRKKLQEMGFIVFDIPLKDTPERLLRKELSGVDCIFVAGGNTFYLLEHAQKSGFTTVARELVQKGVIYIGSSAGSVLAGPNIEPVKVFDDPDIAQLDSYTGLGFVDFIALPHYVSGDSTYKKVIEDYKGKYTFVPLSNEQAVIATEKGHEIISSKP